MKQLIISIIILVILSGSVLGFGVTDWFSGPIVVAPGSTKEVPLELQNMIGNEDLVVKANIKEGSELVTIKEGEEIDVPLNTRKSISAVVNVPETYPEGEYTVSIEFITLGAKGDGQVQIGTGITKTFSVNINKGAPPSEIKQEYPANNIGWISVLTILTILIIIAIIVRFIGKKK